VLISLPLFHWAHRFRFTLVDLGLKAAKGPIAIFCYGSALAGTVIAAFVLLRIWA
jgi:fumarate reductase subunit D